MQVVVVQVLCGGWVVVVVQVLCVVGGWACVWGVSA